MYELPFEISQRFVFFLLVVLPKQCNKLDSEKGGENDVDLLCGEKTDDGISVTWQRLLNPDDKWILDFRFFFAKH